MSKRAKEIIYLIAAAPSATLLYIICGLMDWTFYGDMRPPPIDGWLFLVLTFLLIVAVNILFLKRFRLMNFYTIAISVLEIVVLYSVGLIYF
jgi:L-asparagine transporter-like permease